jgi:hypothetical protein
VIFALHASGGYEHLCTIVVQGRRHDDVTAICERARAERPRIAVLILAAQQGPPEETASAVVDKRGRASRPPSGSVTNSAAGSAMACPS